MFFGLKNNWTILNYTIFNYLTVFVLNWNIFKRYTFCKKIKIKCLFTAEVIKVLI